MVPAAKCPGSTLETHGLFGSPVMFPTTFVHFFPPSRVTWRLPSSVPTQTTIESFGDSPIAKIVVCISALELSTVTPPDCSCFCFSESFVLRSGEMRSHDWPWLRDRKRYCAPM